MLPTLKQDRGTQENSGHGLMDLVVQQPFTQVCKVHSPAQSNPAGRNIAE